MAKYGVNLDETIKRAIKEYDKEKTAEKRKGVLHNTRLLLRHYNDLKTHYELAIDESDQIEIEFDINAYDITDVYIQSTMRSRVKTLIMVSHIDMAMEQLKHKYKQSGMMEKYKALEMVYLENKTYEDVGEQLNCGKATIGRWVNHAVSDLSVFLFGVDGMRMM